MLESKYTEPELDHFRKMRVVLLVPVMYDYPRFWASVVNMVAFSWHHGLRIEEIAHIERTVIDWARDELAEGAIKRTSLYSDELYTHLLWLDTDHIFQADLCCQLARHDVDMVSAVYYKRFNNPTPVAYVRNEKDPDGLSHFPLLELPPRICEVDAAGFGAMLMKREVLEKVPKPWFTIDWRGGEDIAFCAKAKKHGVKIFVDGAYTMAHIGPENIVSKKNYDAWYRDNEEKIKADRVQVFLGGKENGRVL